MTDRAQTVLVTGAAGFIGSHVVELLLAQGRRVIAVDVADETPNLAAQRGDPRLSIVTADLRGDFTAALAGLRPDAVVHLAAQISVPRSLEDPIADLDLNLRATVRLLQWSASVGARRLVFASSAAVYGEPARMPVSEDMADQPSSPYGASKRASELYLGCLGPALGVETAALRLFNVYGPRQDPGSPYSGVISQFIARARERAPLRVLGDGRQTRDFVYVGDVARAFARALDVPKLGGLVCNIGTGVSVSIAGLAAAVSTAAGSASPIVHGPARAGDIAHSRAECSRAHDRLGFAAEVPLAEGLRRTLAAS
jgi:UDP-glucose 4-epimerase